MAANKDEIAEALLQGAYALQTPADHKLYYRDFAAHYDSAFAAGLGYIYPARIAAALAALDLPEGPILDIGCGTGLVAAELHNVMPDAVIDGVDISPEMLEQAQAKGDYANLYNADLTTDFSHLPKGYAAIVSAGTFTHGHLGSEPLTALMMHGKSGGIAAIGVNAAHFAAHDFAATLRAMEEAGGIEEVRLCEVPIYDGSDIAHADDTAFILQMRIC
jgi:predicted TPR repeat methyltransferase